MLQPLMPYVEYELNRSYIASNLCENIDEPELQCNGSCHLRKQIKKQAEEKENQETVLVDMEKLPIAVLSPLPSVPEAFPTILPHPSCDFLLTEDYHSDIFHPPTV